MRSVKLFTITACLIVLCSGCWDKQELEDNTFAVLLGLDMSGDRNMKITVAYPQTQLGVGIQEGMEYAVMSATASSLTQGLDMLGIKLAGPLDLHSVKTVVISQKFAESGAMTGRLFSSLRHRQVRNTANILISACTAQEFINARVEKPAIDLLRQEELLLEQANKSAYYKPLQLLDFIINLKSDGADSAIMYGNLAFERDTAADNDDENDDDDENDEDEENSEGDENDGDNGEKDEDNAGDDIPYGILDMPKGFLPGKMPVKANNHTQICGLAVFRGDKMVGALNSAEAQTFSMLTSNKLQKTLVLPDPTETDEYITASVQRGFSKINSRIDGERVVFDITLGLRCTIEHIPDGCELEMIRESVREACLSDAQALIEKVQKEFNADVLKLSNKLRFKNIMERQAFNWREKYGDAEINVMIDVKIIQNSPHKSL
jgi:hypothetical protein